MAKQDYSVFGDMAKELLEEFGEDDIVWTQNRNSDPDDPDEPWLEGDTMDTTTHKVTMAFLPDDRDQRETQNFTRRSEVPRGNTQAYLGPVGFSPSIKDTIYRPSLAKTYAISTLTTIQPSDQQAVLHQVRLS